jgi:hypothetical protein
MENGLHYLKVASDHIETMKQRVSKQDYEDFHKEIQAVMSAMYCLWDWTNVQQDKPL